jgi:hypothetical protein
LRTDDYKNAIKLAQAELAARPAAEVAALAGAVLSDGALALSFMGRPALVDASGYSVRWADGAGEFALTDAVLVLHYLQGAKGVGPAGEWLAYRQIPGGEFYFAAFRKRAEIPLIKAFGRSPGLLSKAAALMGGRPAEGLAGEACAFRVLPCLDLLAMIHLGDEEFEPDGQVLFDKSVIHCLGVEDASWLGSALAYRLMGLAPVAAGGALPKQDRPKTP